MSVIFALVFFVCALHALGAVLRPYAPYPSRGRAVAMAIVYGGLFGLSYNQVAPHAPTRLAAERPDNPTGRENMSYSACLASIRTLGTQVGSAPINIIETNNLRVVRFPASDGSMLVTCNGIEGFRVINLSKNRCGVEVNC